jgi:hypothetical protein
MDNKYDAPSNSQAASLATPENQQKWSQLAKRAAADETLKQRLLNDPVPLLQEQGIEMPAGAVVQVVEDGGIFRCLVGLAKAAAAAGGAELTAKDLSSVVGGGTSNKGGDQPVEYLKYKLTEVFVSTYSIGQ